MYFIINDEMIIKEDIMKHNGKKFSKNWTSNKAIMWDTISQSVLSA